MNTSSVDIVRGIIWTVTMISIEEKKALQREKGKERGEGKERKRERACIQNLR